MNRPVTRTLLWLWLLLAAGPLFARDLLVGTNGEQFVGTVITETESNVVFESEMAGRLAFPLSKIRSVQRAPTVTATNGFGLMTVTGAPNAPSPPSCSSSPSPKTPGMKNSP